MTKFKLLQEYIELKGIDGILIYNSVKEEPSYVSALLAQEPFDTCYVFVENGKAPCMCIASWFAELAKEKFPSTIIIPAAQKRWMITYMLPLLKNIRTLGIAWNIPYKDYLSLKNTSIPLIDIEEDLQKLYALKTTEEKHMLQELRNYTINLLAWINIIPGLSEKDLEKNIKEQVTKDWYELNFLSIAWSEQLKLATVGEASEAIISQGDVVCIDIWVIKYWYHSDATRCYFVWENELKISYQNIQKAIFSSLPFITPGWTGKELIQHLERISKELGLTWYIFQDLWHGIWTSLHEYPDLYHDDFVFQVWMVFTLEPEYRVGDYLLRYEDVFHLDNDGVCKLLT